MSIDASREYIIPSNRLAQAIEALGDIAAKLRKPTKMSLVLPDGTHATLPCVCAPDDDTDAGQSFNFQEDGRLNTLFRFRVAIDEEIEQELQAGGEVPFDVRRSKSGGARAIFTVGLSIHVEEPYALISFDYLYSRGVILFALKGVCNVLDYVGRCADCLVSFERSMGEESVIEPFRGPLPDLYDPEDEDAGREGELSQIVRYVERQAKGAD